MKDQYKIFDNLIEGVQVIDREFRYVYLNHAIVQQSKAKREDLIGFTMMEKYPGIENTEVYRHISNCIHHKTSRRMLNEFKFPDGTLGSFELSIQPFEDAVLIMSVDVTEKKNIERELLRSHDFIELSQELALIGSYEYDLVSGLIRWSPTTYLIMGRSEKHGEPAIEDVRNQIHPDDEEKVNSTLQNAILTGMPYTHEYRIVTPEGQTKYIRAIGKPLTENGRVKLIRGCIQDITLQKAMETAHSQKEQSYRLLFEGIQESFVVHDVVTNERGEIIDLRFSELNPVTERMLGRPKAEIIGRVRSEIMGPLDAETLKVVTKVALERESVKFERFVPSLGRWFSVLIYSPQPGQIATLNLDITDRKKAQDKLEKLNEELEEKVRERTGELIAALEREREVNDIKSKFVTIASHEFRTPLTTLLSSTFLIEQLIKANETDKTGKHIQRIKDAVRSLTLILEDFLSLEKLEQGKIHVTSEVIDLPSFIQDIVDKLNGITKEGQEIFYKHSGLPEIPLDKKILENVLHNLLSNAIKYSSKDVNLSTDVHANHLSISVSDQGIGIPVREQAHLFDMFFRASNVSNIQGTGLGLNIVKRYIELLGGTIDFTSSSAGTTFKICIPLRSYA